MDKEHALDKWGLPLTRYCTYFKVNDKDAEKIKEFCKKNEIFIKSEDPDIFAIENEAQNYLITRANDKCNLNLHIQKQQKGIIDLLENKDMINILINETSNDEEVLYEIHEWVDDIFDNDCNIFDNYDNRHDILNELIAISTIKEGE